MFFSYFSTYGPDQDRHPVRATSFALPLAACFATLALSSFSSSVPADDQASFDYDAFILSNEQLQNRQMQQLIKNNQDFQHGVILACGQTISSSAAAQPLNQWGHLKELQILWKQSAQQWQKIQMFPLGPNTDTTVRLNITFWPDKKNLVERKVEGLIKQGGDVDLSLGGIAVQGLAASEYLLYDPRHLQHATVQQTCPALQAISEKSLANSQALLTRWQESEFLEHWHDAGLGNDTFASITQATGYLLAGLAQSAEIVAKDKVYKPFRLNTDQARSNVYLSENWRSGLNLDNIQQNITDIEHLYLGADGHNGPHRLLLKKGFTAEAEAIQQQLSTLKEQASQLQQMQQQAFAQTEGRALAKRFYQNLKQLEQALKKPLPSFNLAQKFNSRDGD
ncbi:imelysin family protein [Oceanospirillum beijerinckii]|uniref:imelysin family protein n=1 Tax=Oceanospirillum beijerinckii TaxID=64976 RepID=UPI0004127AB9|nr:imelysin family protein [Oceanospirillum beijerinckii]